MRSGRDNWGVAYQYSARIFGGTTSIRLDNSCGPGPVSFATRRSEGAPNFDRPANLLIALAAYTVSLLFTIPFSIYLRGEFSIAPFLFASSQAVLGYFIGIYVDRVGKSAGISFTAAAWQSALQLAATLIAFLGAPPLRVPRGTSSMCCPSAPSLQFNQPSALSDWRVVSARFYKRAMPLPVKSDNNVAARGIPVLELAF